MNERNTISSGSRTISRPTYLNVLLAVGVFLLLSGVAVYPPLLPPDQARKNGAGDTSEATVESLRAFAKVYGYVRYFHPSDAASAIDWERFAVHGVRAVTGASSPADLAESLEALFLPIAPTLQIYAGEEGPPAPAAVLTPTDTTGLKLVAWQHLGVGLGNPGPYRSIRLNRLADAPTSASRTFFSQRIDATPFRGTTIRLSASVRTDVRGAGNQAHLGLFTALPNGQAGFMDFMQDRPITDPEWQVYTLTGPVAEEADSIGVGGMLVGSGKAWFDDFQLHVRAEGEDAWSPVRLANAGFEAETAEGYPGGWDSWGEGYRVQVDTLETYAGRSALAIAYDGTPRRARPLFEAHPKAGEVVERALGWGLSAQIPLALYSRDGQTLRPDDAPPTAPLEATLAQIALDELTAADEALRYADVIIAWNVFQHFYPYFDVVDVDWDAVLTETLLRAGDDERPEDFLYTLRWMVAQLDDGHGYVHHPLLNEQAGLPFLVDSVEGEVVVVAVADEPDPGVCVARGDVVTALDGVPAAQVLSEAMQHHAGSPQWKTWRALRELGRGEPGSRAHLTLERSGETIPCEVVRDFSGALQEERPEPLAELQEAIYYVDLSRAEMQAIEGEMQALAEARGVVFDLRGYPNSTHGVLQYLTETPLSSAHWQVPQQIYPDRIGETKFDTTGRWTLPPKKPRLKGKIVFLTNERAISYAETVMGIVEHYRLGEIVGRPTAGANGNVNPFVLPGGYRFAWTGMRVVKHDGSQHHLVGILPTIPVERTLEGIRAGRDETLEKALELIESSTSDDE